MPRVSIPLEWGRPTCTSCWAQAREYGYRTLALTDTNLCGGLEFARLAGQPGPPADHRR